MAVPFLVATLARRGLLRPGPPADVIRQFAALHRWGFGLAGELRQAAARDPGRVAVIDEQRALTYRELLDRAERLARALRADLGVEPGDRVGLLCRNSAGMIETLVAVTSLGADAVLVNTGLSGHQLAAVAREQRLRTVIHDDEFELPEGLEGIGEARREELIGAAPPGELTPPGRAGRTIVLTSGTTGVPKGAMRRTPGGFGPLCSMIDRIPLRAGERVLIAAPLFHTWGYAGLQIALALRATIVLRRRFEPATALAALVDEKCTAMVAVPVMLQQLMELAPDGPRPPLRVVAVSGSALPGGLATRFMDRYGDVLYNVYGSTEVSWASIATPADLRAAPNTAGRPPHGTRAEVLDEAGRPLPAGAVGRLFVGNEMLFEGYTNGASRERRDGLLATGDLGHVDAAGRVFVDGREDDMIVSGGENVFPAEVENLLADLPQVREVAVVGVPDTEYGQRLAAYLVLHPGEILGLEAVRDHVRGHLARFCVPRDVMFLPSLPRNATGKVLTRDLPR
ncbi:acyl-CoA synthetase [Actinoplanes sp. ATCC 53533]|uniref:AMP-binding protein n=1 Tax=Actinoplanes sp. ATCC 53533 TaxID=1288362 RepID=UPI000F7793FF|nr:AMP-binding protein [Actinoplanes sp. ATCC 53533]RSM47463.1 acyl-CoA synthetase [Actinoplanes sp. ATCC 53533]